VSWLLVWQRGQLSWSGTAAYIAVLENIRVHFSGASVFSRFITASSSQIMADFKRG
jgi:hypothetical protein